MSETWAPMTDEEIVRDYQAAKSPLKQVGILAQLNNCSKERIKEILVAAGCELPAQMRPRPKKAPEAMPDVGMAAKPTTEPEPDSVPMSEVVAVRDALPLLVGEAADCPAEHQIAVAAVVVNRVNDERFPDTVRGVVAQPGQYHPSYLTGFARTTRSCYEAAKAALDGTDAVPDDVVWQAQFPQGRETWWISDVDTGWFRSTTWFCR